MENITLFGRTLTPEQLQKVVVIAGVAIGGLLFTSSTLPLISEYTTQRDAIAEREQQLLDKQLLVGSEAQIVAKKTRVERNLVTLRNRFPPRNQMLSTLLVDLSSLFRESNTTLVAFRPTEFKPLEQASLRELGKMSVEITAQGSYPSLILLFDLLSRYERVLTVSNPKMSPGSSDGSGTLGNELTVTFTLNTYALNQ
jgi:Tfp pilus assembly protein PilO